MRRRGEYKPSRLALKNLKGLLDANRKGIMKFLNWFSGFFPRRRNSERFMSRKEMAEAIREAVAAEMDENNHDKFLSHDEIVEAIELGDLEIYPRIHSENIGKVSVDLTLGEYYFLRNDSVASVDDIVQRSLVYNPADEHTGYWCSAPAQAIFARDYCNKNNVSLTRFEPSRGVVEIPPGQSVLAHSYEHLRLGPSIMLVPHRKSTFNRGDIDIRVSPLDPWFCGRATFCIYNPDPDRPLVLGVERKIIEFNVVRCLPVPMSASQKLWIIEEDIEIIWKKWDPFSMLPRLFLDPEMIHCGSTEPEKKPQTTKARTLPL
jgi:deoxycytidine triphosphate deaminase